MSYDNYVEVETPKCPSATTDILAYGTGAMHDALWFATGNSWAPFFSKKYGFQESGIYDKLLAGDFNGDGLTDVVAYGWGSSPDALWLATGNSWAPFFSKKYGFQESGTFDILIAGQFDGN